ncbi:RNA recognition motif 2-domain-containing protein [Mycena amicta]|nr:RNA recognition motif 2-domain-containing protein [Mycena amicta]
MVSNVCKDLDPQTLKFAVLQALDSPPGEALNNQRDKIKGISTHFQPSQGVVILVFYDVRQAKSANVILSTPTTGPLAQCIGEEQSWFECSFVTAEDVLDLVGGFSFVMEPPLSFGLSVEIRGEAAEKNDVDVATLLGVLKAQGDLRSLGRLQEIVKTSNLKLFRVEFYDVRDNETALHALDGRVFFGMHLSVLKQDVFAQLTDKAIAPAGHNSQIRKRFLFIDTTGPRSVGAGHESTDGPADPSSIAPSIDSPPLFYTSTSPSTNIPPASQTPDSHIRRASNHLFFDAVGRPFEAASGQMQQTPKRSRSASHSRGGREQGYPSGPAPLEYYPMQHYYNGCPTPPLPAFPFPYPPPPPLHPQFVHPSMCYPPPLDPGQFMNGWSFDQAMMMPPPPLNVYGSMHYPPPSGPSPGPDYWVGAHPPPMGYVPFPNPIPPQSPGLVPAPPSPPSTVGSVPPRALLPPNPHVVPNPGNNDRNQLNISRIEDGQDTRTTVMIKNIPNKMNDKDLMAFIGNVCHRRIDFLYLRMDFQNGCNVGYAFVNFITVQDLLRFAKAKLGEKWNMFSSEKVLQMSYANYQGKEALVEKFKNSCIMDERPAWQPKIFYSNGPELGLPEPFPAPTHLRRKERSSYNRGPLYVPGMMGSGMQASLAPQARRPQIEAPRARRIREDNTGAVTALAEGVAAARVRN